MIELIVNKPSVTFNIDETANICFVINKNNLAAIDSIKTDKFSTYSLVYKDLPPNILYSHIAA